MHLSAIYLVIKLAPILPLLCTNSLLILRNAHLTGGETGIASREY